MKSVRQLFCGHSKRKFSVALRVEQNQGSLKEVLDRLDQQSAAELDYFTYARLIRECGTQGSISDGKKLQFYITKSGLDQEIYIQEYLVHMYLKCGSFGDAELLFNKIQHRSRDVTVWTAILGGYINSRKTGMNRRIFKLYHEMLQGGVKPDMFTFTTMLKACVVGRGLSEGKMIHSQIMEYGCDGDAIVGTSIISMYGKCDSLEDARAWFDRIGSQQQHDVVTWNAMVSTYVQYGCYQKAFELFRLMLLENVRPNAITFVTILNACNFPSALEIGKVVNACVSEFGLESDVILGTALLNMYAKCESMEDAQKMFDRIEEPDIVSWNSLISAYVRDDHQAIRGSSSQALKLFKQLLLEGMVPNEITFISVLNACSRPLHLQDGRAIHCCVAEAGLDSTLFVGNALIDMFGKCACLKSAETIFEQKMVDRNLVTWSVMISAYAENGHGKEALEIFKTLLCDGVNLDPVISINVLNACAASGNILEGRLVHRTVIELGFTSDVVVATALVNMYIRCGSLELAREVFDEMNYKNSVSWNTMITGYVQNGHPKQALNLFQKLEPGVADQTTYVVALDACARLSAAAEGKLIHQEILQRRIRCDLVLVTALISMYGRCGCLEKSRELFQETAGDDVVAWNSMLGAYAQNGQITQALQLFGKMQQEGVKADSVTFVSVLCACSHAGSFELAAELFVGMVVDHGRKALAEHYGCMVDLLSRLGMLKEAEEFIGKLPKDCSARDVEWITLLAGCRTQRDSERGEIAADGLLSLRPQDSSAYVVLSSIRSDF